MANDFSTRIWAIDTAMASSIFDDGIYLRRLEWHPNATDDDLLVEDASGADIWRIRATAGSPNNESYGFEVKDFEGKNGELFYGFRVTTIDGGTLYVTYG